MRDINSMTLPEIEEAVLEMGEPKYRAKQIFTWIQRSGVTDYDQMTNISKALRLKLYQKYDIFGCTIEKKLISEYDNTVKYLFKLHDGSFIESVLMKYKYGYTLCVSTQVGCNMGCQFCASTISGKERDLTAGEILYQIHAAQRDMNVRVSHVVLMGMGEPLDNFENVVRFLNLVSCEDGLNIGMRNISLSTCGLVPRMDELAGLKLQLTLSVSLHAPNDEIRTRLMPVNRRWHVRELIDVCRRYIQQTGRRISFEYAMIRDVNDSDECAAQLAALLKGMLCHVNLIPVNTVRERDFVKSDKSRLESFTRILEHRGINVTVRRSLGSDINASCGQLRRAHREEIAREGDMNANCSQN